MRLKRDYLEMAEERRENDRIVEETKKEADELEKKLIVAKEAAVFAETEVRELMERMHAIQPLED